MIKKNSHIILTQLHILYTHIQIGVLLYLIIYHSVFYRRCIHIYNIGKYTSRIRIDRSLRRVFSFQMHSDIYA